MSKICFKNIDGDILHKKFRLPVKTPPLLVSLRYKSDRQRQFFIRTVLLISIANNSLPLAIPVLYNSDLGTEIHPDFGIIKILRSTYYRAFEKVRYLVVNKSKVNTWYCERLSILVNRQLLVLRCFEEHHPIVHKMQDKFVILVCAHKRCSFLLLIPSLSFSVTISDALTPDYRLAFKQQWERISHMTHANAAKQPVTSAISHLNYRSWSRSRSS